MIKIENKFLVINYKRFKEIEDLAGNPEMNFEKANKYVTNLLNAIDDFIKEYTAITGKEINQEYYVVNKDEPYSEQVKNLILNNLGENQ